jgi:hypothetical protein
MFMEFEITRNLHTLTSFSGIASRWVLQLDEEGSIFYSTAPTWIKTAQSAIDMGIAHESGV